MPGELIKPLIESAQRGDVLLLVAVLFVVVIANFARIDRFFMDRKKVRLKGIEEALRSGRLDAPSSECLKEQAATEHFYVATGIRLERAPRQALLRVYEKSAGALRFAHFKRAVPHYDYKDGQLEVRVGAFERLWMWVGLGFGIPVFILSLPLFFVVLYLTLFQGADLWSQLPTTLLIVFIGMWTFIQSLPAYSARLVQKEMKRQIEDQDVNGGAAPPAQVTAPKT